MLLSGYVIPFGLCSRLYNTRWELQNSMSCVARIICQMSVLTWVERSGSHFFYSSSWSWINESVQTMIQPGSCFISKDAIHDDCIHAYRMVNVDSVEHLCVSDSTMRITTHSLDPNFDFSGWNSISNSVYDEVRLLIVQLFSSFQSQVAELSSSTAVLSSSETTCFLHNGGVCKNNGIPKSLTKAIVTGIHFSHDCNLHRSIEMVPPDELHDETKYQAIDDIYYDRIDKLIKTVNSSARDLFFKE